MRLKGFALSILGAAGGLLLYCGSFYAKSYMENLQEQKKYEVIKDTCLAGEEDSLNTGEKPDTEKDASSELKARKKKADKEKTIEESFGISWKKLSEINPEIIGWITVPGADISYPVVQGKDDEYYLNHSITGEKDPFGAVFLGFHNNKNFLESHSFLYGHNMEGNMMFANLNRYESPEFLEQCPEFYVITPKRKFCYEIFSVEQAVEDSISFRYGYELESDTYRKQLEILKENSIYNTGVTPDAGNTMVTLVTCNSRLDEYVRMTVHGICRKIETEEK